MSPQNTALLPRKAHLKTTLVAVNTWQGKAVIFVVMACGGRFGDRCFHFAPAERFLRPGERCLSYSWDDSAVLRDRLEVVTHPCNTANRKPESHTTWTPPPHDTAGNAGCFKRPSTPSVSKLQGVAPLGPQSYWRPPGCALHRFKTLGSGLHLPSRLKLLGSRQVLAFSLASNSEGRRGCIHCPVEATWG